MQINGIPVYHFTIDESISDEGVTIISLVDDPAVEKTFIKLSENNPPVSNQNPAKTVRLQHNQAKLSVNNEKRIITGVALRPDFPIYRNDGGEEYYLMLSKEEVLKIAQKFMKEQRLKSVNLNHRFNTKDIYLFESYITGDKHKPAYAEFQDIEDGSWMVSYKIDNDDVWESIKKGEFKGFSVEMAGELSGENNDKKLCKYLINKSKIMVKSKLRVKLEAFLKGIIKLGSVTTEENIELFFDGDELAEGMQVFIQDDDGVLVLAPDGDYNHDGKVYTVESGVVEKISSATVNARKKSGKKPLNKFESKSGGVTEERFNELAEIVREAVIDIENLKNLIEQSGIDKNPNQDLKKEVETLNHKLDRALKNSGLALKQNPIPVQEKNKDDKTTEFFAAIQK